MAQPARARLPKLPLITLPRLLLLGLVSLYLLYFGLYATRRHLAFETGAFDLGVYAQPMWNYIHGRDFAVSLIEDNGPLRWATHVEPILFGVALFYRVWPDPRTLIWLQVAGISLAALPLFGLAVRRLGGEWPALVVALAYFVLPATEAVTLFDFHAVALAPLFLLSAILFLDLALAARGQSFWLWPEVNIKPTGSAGGLRLNYALAALFFLLALSTKEDISLHIFMLGLYLLILRRQWWAGGLLCVVGLAWFLVAFQIVIPAYRVESGQSIYTAWFETLGRTPLEIALSPLTAPDKVLALLFRPDALPPLAMITVPLALLLPLAGLPFLLMAAPSLAFTLLSQNPTLRQLETWHYAAPMIPFIMLATIDGQARLAHYLARFTSLKWRPTLAGLALLLLVTSLTYHYWRGYSHLARLPEWPEITAHHQLGREIAATIPAEAAVLAQAQLIPHVAHREQLAIWSGPLLTDYDYIWLDLSHPKLPNRFNAHGEFLTGMVIEPAFGPVAARDGYVLLKKGADRIPLPEELFTFTEFDRLPKDARPFNAIFGDSLRLVGVKPDIRRLTTSDTEPQVILYFEALDKPAQDYHLFIYLLDQTGAIVGATDYAQPALFWWPTSRWQAGDRRQVRVNTIPWWTGDPLQEDRPVFGYALGLSRSDDPWDVSARLPVMIQGGGNSADSQPLDQGTLLPIAAFRRLAGLPYPQPLTILGRADSE